MKITKLTAAILLYAVVWLFHSLVYGVDLTWQYTQSADPSAQADAIEIERRSGDGSFVKIGQVAATVKAFTDDPGQGVFCYRVRAVNVAGTSGYSNTACTLASPENLRVKITIELEGP